MQRTRDKNPVVWLVDCREPLIAGVISVLEYIHDRLRVVESLWDSIPADSPVEISPEQRAELQRRIAAHERSPEQLLTWDEVLDRLRDSR